MEDLQEIDHKAFDADHMRNCLLRWPHRAAPGEGKRCFSCAYFIPMVGVFAEEAGACTHARSPCDGRLTARQDGCDEHVPSDYVLKFTLTYPRPEHEELDPPPDDWEPER